MINEEVMVAVLDRDAVLDTLIAFDLLTELAVDVAPVTAAATAEEADFVTLDAVESELDFDI